MASGSKAKGKPKPVMVRVPYDWLELLEAAQYVRRHDSTQALVLEVLRQFLTVVKDEPEIPLAIKARADRDARLARSIVDLSVKASEAKRQHRKDAS